MYEHVSFMYENTHFANHIDCLVGESHMEWG